MATDVERLAVLIEANTKSYERAMSKMEQRTQQSLSRIERQFADSGAKVDAFLGKIGNRFKGLLTVAAVTQVAGSIRKIVSDLDAIGDAAERAGVSTDFLQALGFKVELAGGSFEDAARAAARFGKELGDVNVAQSYLGRLLAANGVDVTKFGNDSAAAFEAYSRVVANAKSPQEALNMVAGVFGDKVGPKLVTTLQEIGQKGLPAFIEAMKEAGIIIDERLIKSADKLDQKWNEVLTRLGNKIKGFVVRALDFEALADLKSLKAELADLEDRKAGVANAVTSAVNPKMFDGRITELRDLIGKLEREQNRIVVTPKNPSRNVSTSAPSSKRDEFERDLKRLREQLALMEKESEVIDLGTYARERAMIVTKLETAAKEANAAAGLKNTEVTQAQRTEIEKMADAYANAAVTLEAAKGPLRDFAREGTNVNLQLQDAIVGGLKGFEDALVGVIQGTKDAKTAFRDMANAIITDMIRIAIRSSITAPLAGMFSGIFSGLPGRAVGGPVSSGQAYMVGERGPEVFVPSGAGRIVANKDMRGGGGASISMPITIDARGADQGAVVRIAQAVDSLKKTLPQQIDARVMSRQTRGVRA